MSDRNTSNVVLNSAFIVIRTPLPDVSIPASILFDPGFPASVMLTLIQLVALSSNVSGPSSLSLHELSELTGKSQRTLSRHIHQLASFAGLDLISLGEGRFTVSFPGNPPQRTFYPPNRCTAVNAGQLNARTATYPEFNSYFPERIMGYISYQDDLD